MIKITSFSELIRKNGSKNEATSNLKIQKVLSSLFLNDIGIYLRKGPISGHIGIFKLHPTKGTHWIVYINENYFDSFICGPPNKLSKLIIKINGNS